MSDFISEVLNQSSAGNYYYIIFPISLIVLVILMKGRRVKFVIPALLISIVIINPVFLKIWSSLNLYAYWRVLWAVPVIPICATIPAIIAEKINNKKLKIIVGILCMSVFIGAGSFLYKTSQGSFDIYGVNRSKIPQYVVDISDYLLQLDDNPRVVAHTDVSVYMRQYTGEIDTLFGRDIFGYIASPKYEAQIVNKAINDDSYDISMVSRIMLDNDYDYLVIPTVNDQRASDLSKNGFELLNQIDGYDIYQVHGNPGVIKDRNELGQVIKETIVDTDGKPCNGNDGYACTQYEYDRFGRIISEYYYQSNGVAYTNSEGYCGIENTYDKDGNIISVKYMNSKRELTQRSSGYAEARWIKDDTSGKVNLHLYDDCGKEVELVGKNLFIDCHDGWSEWLTPNKDEINSCFDIGSVNLGENKEGDSYICEVEIEFKNIESTQGKEFGFWAQGPVDQGWDIYNIWNSDLVILDEAPLDGIYKYSSVIYIDDDTEKASCFDIGFRCDNWADGSFRVKNIVIKKL